MTKYDFNVDLGLNTSTGIILSKIQPNSTVLEFGCATGRMTKFMKNALNCQVFIVEYDKEAFDIAIQYATGGVCDDILTLSWLDEFKEIEFDSIIFADVLEHLTQPAVALSNALQLLKEQGRVYVSIPNIAHNDILLKAFNNHFDYTKVGILDDTHVHFWGYENIIPFAENNGYFVHSIDATYLSTGQTEQYNSTTLKCSPILYNYFNERRFAEAYQFVIELGRKREADDSEQHININYRKNFIISHLYMDRGEGFNEKDIIAFTSENTEPGRYVAHYVINDVKNVKRLRFDPIEFQGCILQNVSVRQGGKELECIYSEHLKFEEGILMIGTDPMVFIDLITEMDTVTVDADIVILGDEYLDMIQSACCDKYSEIENLNEKIACLNIQNGDLHKEIENLNLQSKDLHEEIKNLNVQKGNLHKEIENLNLQSKDLHEEIKNLNVQKGNLHKEIENLNLQNENLYEEIENINVRNGELHKEIEDLDVQKENLNIQNDSLRKEINTLDTENDRLYKEIERLHTQTETFQNELETYMLLANKKDELLIKKEKYITSIEQQMKETEELSNNRGNYIINLEHWIEEKDESLKNKDDYIADLEQQIDHYKKRKCIIICDLYWKIYWSIRLKLGKLIRKKTRDE